MCLPTYLLSNRACMYHRETYPTKHWTSDRYAVHVYTGSVGPWPTLYDICTGLSAPQSLSLRIFRKLPARSWGTFLREIHPAATFFFFFLSIRARAILEMSADHFALLHTTVHTGPTSINARSSVEVEKKTSPSVTKQPLQQTKIVRPKMPYKRRHSDVSLLRGI